MQVQSITTNLYANDCCHTKVRQNRASINYRTEFRYLTKISLTPVTYSSFPWESSTVAAPLTFTLTQTFCLWGFIFSKEIWNFLTMPLTFFWVLIIRVFNIHVSSNSIFSWFQHPLEWYGFSLLCPFLFWGLTSKTFNISFSTNSKCRQSRLSLSCSLKLIPQFQSHSTFLGISYISAPHTGTKI